MDYIRYVDDCQRIRECLLGFKVEATLAECQLFWGWLSFEECTQWMALPKDEQSLAAKVGFWLPKWGDRRRCDTSNDLPFVLLDALREGLWAECYRASSADEADD